VHSSCELKFSLLEMCVGISEGMLILFARFDHLRHVESHALFSLRVSWHDFFMRSSRFFPRFKHIGNSTNAPCRHLALLNANARSTIVIVCLSKASPTSGFKGKRRFGHVMHMDAASKRRELFLDHSSNLIIHIYHGSQILPEKHHFVFPFSAVGVVN